MKRDWDVKKLGDIGKVSMCKRVFKDQTTTKGDIPFYKIGTFGKEPDAYISKEIYDEFRKKFSFPKKGDILISASGTTGRRVKYDGEPAYFQDSNIVWIDNNEEQVLNEYLYHFYGACNWNSTKGATISRLYNDNLKQIKIAFPKSLPEQQRLVALLDEVFAAIATAKEYAAKNLQNARELFESVLQGVFVNREWEERKLGEIATFRNGINYTKQSKGELIKIVGVKDFQKNYWVPFDNLDSIRVDEKLSEIDILKENDILTVRSNGNQELIGRCILASQINENVSHSGFTIRIRINSDNVFPQYLCHYLKSENVRRQLIDSGTGVNIKSLNQVTLSSILIQLPLLPEQRAIVAKLDALSAETKKLETIYQQKLTNLEELKKSVLQKAFNGEL